MDYSYLENQIKAAVEVREKGDLNLSRKMFQELLREIKETMESDPSKELKYLFATATGEFIIQQRLENPSDFENVLKLGAELLFYDKQNHLDNPVSIRSVSNTLLDMGQYPEAEEFLQALHLLYKGNSAQEGDTNASLALVYLNTARVEEAATLIDKAISEIEQNTTHKEKIFITTWLSRAFIVKSLIDSAQDKKKEAKAAAEKALKIAKDGKNSKRVLQAQKIVEFLEKNE